MSPRLITVLVFLLSAAPLQIIAQQEEGGQTAAPLRFSAGGVAVEFDLESGATGTASGLSEGADASVRFKITDDAGRPLSNLKPSAWISRREKSGPTDPGECREKIRSFLTGSVLNRPDIDLNSYFVLALNQEANISVVDPQFGFGGSKLLTLISLPSPGEDWVMSADRKWLYVSMPLVGQVAVVDLKSWKALTTVNTGGKPARLALQHDGRYLWVGNDDSEAGRSGVTVIDTTSLKVAARLYTGAGHHEIAFTDDDRYAFISNKQAGTLSVIDAHELVKIRDLKTGDLPVAIAYSALAKAVYVAHEGDGTIVAVDALTHGILTNMKLQPGLRALRFQPDGRFGFAVNSKTDTVGIFDVSSNRLINNVPVGPKPDQITFTKGIAYVRSTGSETVQMIRLSEIGRPGGQATVTDFPGGQMAPQESPFTSLADSIVPAPAEDGVLVANPGDKTIYYYREGMAAPMGNIQNYGRVPRGVLVVDNSLREVSPGVYETSVKLPARGNYDVSILLDSPRFLNCFEMSVKGSPDQAMEDGVPIKVELIEKDKEIHVGEGYNLRFKVTDAVTNQPRSELKDMGMLVFSEPGTCQNREWAKSLGDGIYEMNFVPPQAGVYYVFFQCPSLGVQFKQLPPYELKVDESGATSLSLRTSLNTADLIR